MPKNATIQARIDPKVKKKAKEVTAKTLKKAEKGKELHSVKNLDTLFEELER